jgi:hypothetical protein
MQSNNLKFTFISLNLFILIFFILLASKAALNTDIYSIENIFRSFRGESLNSNPLIVLSAEEQRLVQAKKYFKERLENIFQQQNILYIESVEGNTLFQPMFSIKEMFNSKSSDSTELIKLINKLLVINDTAYGYTLALEIIINEDNIINNIHYTNEISSFIRSLNTAQSKLCKYYIKFSHITPQGYVILKGNLNPA